MRAPLDSRPTRRSVRPRSLLWMPRFFTMSTRLRRVVQAGIGLLWMAAVVGPIQGTPGSIRLEPLVKRLSQPVGLSHAGDRSGRLFIVEQKGVVRIWQNGALRDAPFLDIRDRVASGGEKGLLGLAFHPHFKENRRLFVNYTSDVGGLHTVIAAFQVGADPNQTDPASERILLTIAQPYANHNGGQIAFGPDGYLYIGMGDGGAANDPHGHGQNLATLLGKMLRIDVDTRGAQPYGIPPDNPFVKTRGAAPEVWALGLRNPWRFSFDQASGLLYAGDVGQDAREEIDVIRKGENYGWNKMEGARCTPTVDRTCDPRGLTPPIWDYPRSEGSVVIGGYVYRGSAIPALVGHYIYGDFGNGKIWSLRYDGTTVGDARLLLNTGRNISAFGQDEHGEIYVVDYDAEILKMVPVPAHR